MFTLRKSLVVVAALAASVAVVSPATASPYPEPTEVAIDLDVKACVVGGKTIDISAEAQAGEQDLEGTISIEAFGETYSENDTEISVDADVPVVTQRTTRTIRATFVPSDSSFRTATVSKEITVVPTKAGCARDNGSGDSGGLLPDTGGANVLYILLGVLLLAVGAAVLEVQRRRRNNAL